MQHAELALRYHEAASHPWEFVETTLPAIPDSDAKFLAEDIIDGNVAEYLLPDYDITPKQRAFYALLAESRQRYICEHKSP